MAVSAKTKMLACLKIGPKHGAGAYVRMRHMEPASGRVKVYAGPFLTEADALAFLILCDPASGHGSHEINLISAGEVNYLLDFAGEERGVEEVKMLLPEDCRIGRKGWGAYTKVNAALVTWCRELAVREVGGERPVDLSALGG